MQPAARGSRGRLCRLCEWRYGKRDSGDVLSAPTLVQAHLMRVLNTQPRPPLAILPQNIPSGIALGKHIFEFKSKTDRQNYFHFFSAFEAVFNEHLIQRDHISNSKGSSQKPPFYGPMEARRPVFVGLVLGNRLDLDLPGPPFSRKRNNGRKRTTERKKKTAPNKNMYS